MSPSPSVNRKVRRQLPLTFTAQVPLRSPFTLAFVLGRSYDFIPFFIPESGSGERICRLSRTAIITIGEQNTCTT